MSVMIEQLSQCGVCKTDVTAAELIGSVDEIRAIDLSSERWQKAGCVVIALGIPLLFPITPVLFSEGSLGIASLVAGLTLLIGGLLVRRHFGRTNFENRRYEFVAAIARLLATDMPAGANFSLQMDLRPQDHKSKYQSEGQVGHWKVKYYKDPWLVLKGRLADGTHFDIDLTELHQARSCRKRSRSGKTKYKSKSKNRAFFTVRLKTKSGRYAVASSDTARLRQMVQLPRWASLKTASINDSQFLLTAVSKTPWSVPQGRESDAANAVSLVAGLLLSFYQLLNESRQKHAG